MPDSNSLDSLYAAAGQQYGVDPSLLKAVAQVESGGNVGTRDSNQGAQGLMQMLPATAAAMGASDPRDPAQVIPAAARYLAEGFDKTGSVDGAVQYYHGGPDRSGWGPKTRSYLAKVAGAYASMGDAPVAAHEDPYADLIKEYGTSPAAPADAGQVAVAPAASMGPGGQLPTPASPAAAAPAAAQPSPADPYASLIQEFTKPPAAAGQGVQSVGFAPANSASAANAPAKPPPSPIGVNDAVRAAATGVPIIGGALNKADAALNAALAPVLNPLFAKGDQLQGSTFGDRYRNALTQQEGMDTSFQAEHPKANLALNLAGAVGGTIPAMAAAPAAFGATKAPLGVNLLLGALGGGAVGGADAAVRSGGDVNAAKTGAVLGAGFGLAGPVVGAGVSAGFSRVANALTRTTPAARNVASVMSDIGMTPATAENALMRIGPHATIADLDPALTDEAGGLASLGGQPTSVLKNAMMARGAAADNRVGAMMDQTLGPKPNLDQSLESMLDQGRQAAGPHYDAARANPTAMDVQPLVSDLDQRIAGASGGVADTLRTVRSYLVRDVPGIGTATKSDPEQLLGARQAMDDLIERRGTAETTAGRNALGQAQDVRRSLDTVLKRDPNIAAGDAAFSHQMQLREAMQDGTQLFTRGVRPEEFQRQLGQMAPEQVEAFRSGARVAIGDALEQARQGQLAGARSMFGKSSANRAKLDALFPNAGGVFDALEGEAAMRATENTVARNSATAGRQAIQAKYAPPQGNPLSAAPAVVGEAIGGGPGAVAGMALRGAYGAASNALAAGGRNRLVDGTAQALAAMGPARSAYMDQIARAYGTNRGVSALSGGAGAATNLLLRSTSNPLLRLYQQQWD